MSSHHPVISIETILFYFVAVSRLYQVYLDALTVEIDNKKWRELIHPKYWFLLSIGPSGYDLKVKKSSEFDLRKSIELFLRHPTYLTDLSESNYTEYLLSQAMSIRWIVLLLNSLKGHFNQREDYGPLWINPIAVNSPIDETVADHGNSINETIPRPRRSTDDDSAAPQPNKYAGIPSISDEYKNFEKVSEVDHTRENNDIGLNEPAPSLRNDTGVVHHIGHPCFVSVAQSSKVSMLRKEAGNEDDNANDHRRDDASMSVKVEPTQPKLNFDAHDMISHDTAKETIIKNEDCPATAKDEPSTDEEDGVILIKSTNL